MISTTFVVMVSKLATHKKIRMMNWACHPSLQAVVIKKNHDNECGSSSWFQSLQHKTNARTTSIAFHPSFIGCAIKKTMKIKCDVHHYGFKAYNTHKN